MYSPLHRTGWRRRGREKKDVGRRKGAAGARRCESAGLVRMEHLSLGGCAGWFDTQTPTLPTSDNSSPARKTWTPTTESSHALQRLELAEGHPASSTSSFPAPSSIHDLWYTTSPPCPLLPNPPCNFSVRSLGNPEFGLLPLHSKYSVSS